MDSSLLGLIAFAFTTGMTPGPNNAMLTASGVNYGFRRTVPHMLGVIIGFPAMVLIVALGFQGGLTALPWLMDVIAAIGIVYLVYMAFKIASAPVAQGLEGGAISEGKPFTFIQAAAFQWVNAKAWVILGGAVSIYVQPNGVATVALVFLAGAIVSSLVWAAFGSALSRWLSTPQRLRTFNIVMAVLLLASLYPSIVDLLSRAWGGHG